MDVDSLVGRRLGKYEIKKVISRGSIITTYEGYQVGLNRRVAIQILAPNTHDDPIFQAGFLRGAEIIAMLEHPHIVPVHDYDTQGNIHYIVMRLMDGGTLWDRIAESAVSLQEATATIKRIAEALEFVHARGMVHGDPSTGNIVFDTFGNPYLADFLAAGFLMNQAGLTGTPSYMSPERWRSVNTSPATDQYALSAIAYHVITGSLPFKANNLVGLRNQHLHEMPEPPQIYDPTIPLAVNEVLTRALAKQPEDRYPTVMDFAREFEKAIQALPKHLFISYSRRDKAYAQQLFEYLGSNGFTVWIDSKIEYGDTWFKEIDEAIKSCAAFLLIMSRESYESEWVQKEILLAKRYKKPIFPLLLEGDEFGIVIDLQFADVKGGGMPDTEFHRRLRRTVFGDA